MHELYVKIKHEVDKGFELTEKLNLWDHQKSAEAAHTCAQELMKLHSSSNTLLSKTLKKSTSLV
jgi:hypothetical protein